MSRHERCAVFFTGLAMAVVCGGVAVQVVARDIMGVPSEVISYWLTTYVGPAVMWVMVLTGFAVALFGLWLMSIALFKE